MQYAYIGAVIASFLLSMGNRVKAARWKYMGVVSRASASLSRSLLTHPSTTVQIIIFSVTTAYMFGAAGYCVYKAVEQSAESLIMAQIVISLVSTYGIYILASLIALDPWVCSSACAASRHTHSSLEHHSTSSRRWDSTCSFRLSTSTFSRSTPSATCTTFPGARRSRQSPRSTLASRARSGRTRSTWRCLPTRPTSVRPPH